MGAEALPGLNFQTQCRDSRQKCLPPNFSLGGVWLQTSPAAAREQQQISLHLGADCELPFRTLGGLRTLSATENKDDVLDNHKLLRSNQELQPACLIEGAIPCTGPLWQERKRWHFIWCAETNTEPRNMNKQGNMFQIKEQDLQGQTLMKWR